MKEKGYDLSGCRGCQYFNVLSDGTTKLCEYILQTGRRRPCPPGRGCTVKETGKKQKAKMWSL